MLKTSLFAGSLTRKGFWQRGKQKQKGRVLCRILGVSFESPPNPVAATGSFKMGECLLWDFFTARRRGS
jgi:hypothetical protein